MTVGVEPTFTTSGSRLHQLIEAIQNIVIDFDKKREALQTNQTDSKQFDRAHYA